MTWRLSEPSSRRRTRTFPSKREANATVFFPWSSFAWISADIALECVRSKRSFLRNALFTPAQPPSLHSGWAHLDAYRLPAPTRKPRGRRAAHRFLRSFAAYVRAHRFASILVQFSSDRSGARRFQATSSKSGGGGERDCRCARMDRGGGLTLVASSQRFPAERPMVYRVFRGARDDRRVRHGGLDL